MAFTRRSTIRRSTVRATLTVTTTLILQPLILSQLRAEPVQKDTTDGLDYAVDRLAFEVTKSLAERPAVIIWLFDESGSVSLRRQKIIMKLEQLWPAIKRPHPLYSAIVGFGENIHFLTPQPVEHFQSLKQAAGQLKQDESGVESVFGATIASLKRWKSFPDDDTQIDVSIVIVTDEVGDDQGRLEDAITTCRDQGIRVFCLGNAAPFGRSKGRSLYVYPDAFEVFIPVDQGPEVAIPETLRLPIWPPADPDPLKQVSSGFGPWALSRLCNATGGQFFIVEDTGTPSFPRAAMTDYSPDYAPLAEQKKTLEDSRLRRAIAECAFRVGQQLKSTPRFTFRADSAPTARAELQRAQKHAAVLSFLTTSTVDALKTCVEERGSIKSKRLQAAFDVAYGRALIQTARAAELIYVLAKRKLEPTEFSNERSNTWNLVADPTSKPLRQQSDLVSQAAVYLRRVTAQHPNTPFAYVAKQELDRGTGWKWIESHRDYKDPPGKAIKPVFIYETDPQTGKRRIIGKL